MSAAAHLRILAVLLCLGAWAFLAGKQLRRFSERRVDQRMERQRVPQNIPG
jgi:hypothetical protein